MSTETFMGFGKAERGTDEEKTNDGETSYLNRVSGRNGITREKAELVWTLTKVCSAGKNCATLSKSHAERNIHEKTEGGGI